MKHDLDKFRSWAIANKLTVIPNKSHAVIISPKCRGGHRQGNYCAATISLAIALALQLFLNVCACDASILEIFSAITQAQLKYEHEGM